MNSSVSDWVNSVRSGVSDALHQVFAYIPHILGALVVLFIGVIIAVVLKAIVVRILHAIKLKPVVDRMKLNQVFPGKYDFVELVGDLVKWFFIVVFLLQALAIANLLQVKDLVQSLIAYLPNVVVAVALIFVGGIIADLLARIITGTVTVVSDKGAVVLGNVARYTVWVVVLFTAMAQLKVNTIFLDRLFTGVVALLAIAGGLAFGLGGQGVARDSLEALRRGIKRGE